MKQLTYCSWLIALILLVSCGSTPDNEETISVNSDEYDGKKISIDLAIEKGYVTLTGNGNGTFRNIDVVIQNNLDKPVKLNVRGGLFFSNPSNSEQSLLTTEAIDEVTIDGKSTFTKVMPTVCTDVRLSIPGEQTNWPSNPNPNGSIDEILNVYSKYKSNITQYLARKNPEKFQTEDDQHRFLQVLVWAYTGAEYKQILDMLARDVYGKDIARAKQWLDGIYEDARQITRYIQNKDFKGLSIFLGLEEKIERIEKGANELKEKATDRLNSLRDRFRGN